MGDLSPHFSLSEFACRHCGKANPDPALVTALEKLREVVGLPLRILSGSRCPIHNSRVGGALHSRHLIEWDGVPRASDAADVMAPPSIGVVGLYRAALLVPEFRNGGVGVYPASYFVHLDVRPKRSRWAVLKRGGKTVAIPEEYGPAV